MCTHHAGSNLKKIANFRLVFYIPHKLHQKLCVFSKPSTHVFFTCPFAPDGPLFAETPVRDDNAFCSRGSLLADTLAKHFSKNDFSTNKQTWLLFQKGARRNIHLNYSSRYRTQCLSVCLSIAVKLYILFVVEILTRPVLLHRLMMTACGDSAVLCVCVCVFNLPLSVPKTTEEEVLLSCLGRSSLVTPS